VSAVTVYSHYRKLTQERLNWFLTTAKKLQDTCGISGHKLFSHHHFIYYAAFQQHTVRVWTRNASSKLKIFANGQLRIVSVRRNYCQKGGVNQLGQLNHPSLRGRWMSSNQCNYIDYGGWRLSNDRARSRMAVLLQVKVRGHGFRLRPKSYARCVWHKSVAAAAVCGLWRYISVYAFASA